jgi:hypothetical protein
MHAHALVAEKKIAYSKNKRSHVIVLLLHLR